MTKTTLSSRRTFLHSSAALSLLGISGLSACASMSGVPSKAKVVVIGGGYGGATAAKYVRLLSDYKIDVVLIEPQDAFVSCPMSNLVVSGVKQVDFLTTSYAGLSKNHGVKVVKDFADSIDTAKKTVTNRISFPFLSDIHSFSRQHLLAWSAGQDKRRV